MYSYSDKQNHDSGLEYERFISLSQTKQTLTKEEYEFVIEYDPALKNNFYHKQYQDVYVNLDLYELGTKLN